MNEPMRWRIFGRVVATLGVAALLVVPAVPAHATGHGVYVLQQASSVAELDRYQASIQQALNVPGVLGLSIRVPWTSLEPSLGVYDFSVLNEAKRIAGAHQLAIRFMAGRYTPSFRMGNSMLYDGSDSGGMGAGSRVPLAFTPTGGRNVTFENGWKALVDQLTSWCRGGVSLLHASWPGLLWAELALTNQMMRQRGYSYNVVRDTHFSLLDYALGKTGRSLSVEFPITGHAPNALVMDIRNHLLASRYVSRAILQSNNLSPTTGGEMPPPPRRAGQVVTGSNSYNWSSVFQKARLISAEYVEVYTSSFTGGTSAQLVAQILSFARG